MCALNRLTAGLIVAALDVTAEAAPPAAFSGSRSAPRSPELMIYFSHPIGSVPGTRGARPLFGIRIQEVRQLGELADPEAKGDARRRREWLSWQADTRSGLHVSDMQLKLGSRLTYDLTQQRFGSPERGLSMQSLGRFTSAQRPPLVAASPKIREPLTAPSVTLRQGRSPPRP